MCGIMANKVRDFLLRESILDLKNWIEMCKAAELVNVRSKQLIDMPAVNQANAANVWKETH